MKFQSFKPTPIQLSFSLALLLTAIALPMPLLWDNILIPGDMATYFFENGISWRSLFHIPVEIDCGHPPFLSIYFSIVWKGFGCNLRAMHLAQFPFLWLTFYYTFLIAKKFITSNSSLIWLAVLILADTTIVAQAFQVGYEWEFIGFGLLAFNFLLDKYLFQKSQTLIQQILFLVSLIIIPFIQLRGIPLVAAIFLVECFFIYKSNQTSFFKTIFKNVVPYFLSAGLIIGWYGLHFYETGYWINSPESSWGRGNVTLASFHQLLMNCFFTAWRLNDFGRVGEWLVLFLMLIYFFKKRIAIPVFQNQFLIASVIFLLVSVFSLIILSKPICHRYFLFNYLLLHIFLVIILEQINWKRVYKTISMAVVVVILISGSFWVYPDKIATGWDSTLAHLPYFVLHQQADAYLQKNNFNRNKVATHFPLFKNWQSTNPKAFYPDEKKYFCADIDTTKSYDYILYSNICTAFTDEDFTSMKNDSIIKEWKSGQVKMILYKKR